MARIADETADAFAQSASQKFSVKSFSTGHFPGVKIILNFKCALPKITGVSGDGETALGVNFLGELDDVLICVDEFRDAEPDDLSGAGFDHGVLGEL